MPERARPAASADAGPPTAAGAGPLVIGGYRPEDRAALYDVCLRTGDAGGDATALYRDHDLLGHVYLGAYLALEPRLARVLRRPDGSAVGYAVATADTTAFEQACAASWWPPLRARYPLPDPDDDSPDAALVRILHAGTRTEGGWLADHPAQLHVDLLPEAQGGGHGRRLLEALLEALAAAGAPGLHLGVSPENTAAIGFYRHLGLRTLEARPDALVLGTRLG
ncbi:acetyltransferase (GNAT) family protein [Georgenia soli]|uniref:Acetyltransferase (GNAT) family protein n=1 Tax=Georgenia soli TaxID=638953 RepID=A0A2A9EK29_9MICO|nr:GNAT family N-acetyltransferase [Georgenia soli]PFG38579.1 acetyltransferase (GNAT) family protein [Georgenia soli]